MRRVRMLLLGLGMIVLLAGCKGNNEPSPQPVPPQADTDQPPGGDVETDGDNEPSDGDWTSYSNSRFGFTIDYPDRWQAGKESDNGDGIRLEDGEEATLLAYASHYDEAFAPNLSDSEPTTLNNDRDANLFIIEGGDMTQLRVVFILDDRVQYNLDFDLSTAYYDAHEAEIERIIVSLDFFEGTEG